MSLIAVEWHHFPASFVAMVSNLEMGGIMIGKEISIGLAMTDMICVLASLSDMVSCYTPYYLRDSLNE